MINRTEENIKGILVYNQLLELQNLNWVEDQHQEAIWPQTKSHHFLQAKPPSQMNTTKELKNTIQSKNVKKETLDAVVGINKDIT